MSNAESMPLPTSKLEVFLLPMHAGEISFLQSVLGEFVKQNPFKRDHPMVTRLQMKITFLAATLISLSPESDDQMKEAAQKTLQQAYGVLAKQKEKMENG